MPPIFISTSGVLDNMYILGISLQLKKHSSNAGIIGDAHGKLVPSMG